jgi:hypothetical protein
VRIVPSVLPTELLHLCSVPPSLGVDVEHIFYKIRADEVVLFEHGSVIASKAMKTTGRLLERTDEGTKLMIVVS